MQTIEDEHFYSIFFVDRNIGWIAGSAIFRTADGGGTWEQQNSRTFNRHFALFFLDADEGWAVGANSTVSKTTDGGRLWTSDEGVIGILDLFSVFFVDSTTGWAVGGFKGELERCGVIIKTIDGGETWVQQHDILSSPLTSVKFADSLSGWAVGWNGLILGTTNAGIDWVEQEKPTNWNLSSLAFVNDMTGWAVGARSTILKTNTAGMVTFGGASANLKYPET